MSFLIVNFAVKNDMFNLNENNRFVMAQHPSVMRIGVNGMCGQVRAVGLDPTNGDVYVFVGSSRNLTVGFSSLLSSTIDSTLGLSCKLYGYQYCEIIRCL